MIPELKTNITQALAILRTIQQYLALRERVDPAQRKLLDQSIESSRIQLQTINKAFPSLLQEIPTAQPLPSEKQTPPPALKTVETATQTATIRTEDKEAYLKALRVNEDTLARLKRNDATITLPGPGNYERSRGYIKLSQQLCGSLSRRLIANGHYRVLALTLKKSNMGILFENYISLLLFTTFLSFFVGVGLYILGLFLNLSLSPPFISLVTEPLLGRALALSWIPFLVPLLAYLTVLYYPSTEQSGAATGIEQELPFVVIHMSAISGSGIEPSNIFKIIAESKEYPLLSKEMRKIINQMNVYGYDLVGSLNVVAQNTPSQKLADLFAGLSSTITSGGELSSFFSKRAETLLLDYRLEREKFTKTAETFMDLYITLVIAAPMILLLVIIMLQLSDFDFGIGPGLLTFLIIGTIALLNVIFLSLLQLKQPVN
jgi:pilus assembly protein TadC